MTDVKLHFKSREQPPALIIDRIIELIKIKPTISSFYMTLSEEAIVPAFFDRLFMALQGKGLVKLCLPDTDTGFLGMMGLNVVLAGKKRANELSRFYPPTLLDAYTGREAWSTSFLPLLQEPQLKEVDFSYNVLLGVDKGLWSYPKPYESPEIEAAIEGRTGGIISWMGNHYISMP